MAKRDKMREDKMRAKKKKSKKKGIKKGILGSGGAQKAHNALTGRAAQLDELLRVAKGGKPKKEMKGRR